MKDILLNEHVERDVAVEIMAWKIARCVTLRKGREERDRLFRERMAMYLGDRTVIDRIMTEYAAEAREYFGARSGKTP